MDVKKPIVTLLTILFVAAFLSSCQEKTEEQKTSDYFAQILSAKQFSTARLDQFITAMPKGGDIHHHYSGSIYAETYLDFLEDHNHCIDTTTYRTTLQKVKHAISIKDLRSNKKHYTAVLQLWSDKDYEHQSHTNDSPDNHFFNTFSYFENASKLNYTIGLKILKERAKKEQISYIETMLSTVGYRYKLDLDTYNAKLHQAQSQQEADVIFAQLDALFQKDPHYKFTINQYISHVDSISKEIDDNRFMMRFQTYAVRVLDPVSVYSDLVSGFAVSNLSEQIVGVNIVAPENNPVALRDYNLHMWMFNYLNRKFPKVNRALHAGELAQGMVRPKNMLFHIKNAVSIGKAQRIGHGVDIPFESNSFDLIKTLKDNNIAIEINLTSNEFILGIEGENHPYLLYAEQEVPMVICTDDSGVSRNNLSGEYSKLALRYRPNYQTIKTYAYNSIDYSFLNESDKKAMKNILHENFRAFEKKIATIHDTMQK